MTGRRDPSAATQWDRNARRYHAQEHLERRAIAALVRVAGPLQDAAVVDLATGTGAIPRALAAARPRPASVVGVDRSPGMLGMSGALPDGFSMLRADARAVPLPDAGADLVTCSYLLHILPADARLAVLHEARRLLRPGPGSRLVVATVWADDRRAAGALLRRGLDAAARIAPGRLGGLATLDPTSDLERAGFRVTTRVVLPTGGYPSLVLRADPAG